MSFGKIIVLNNKLKLPINWFSLMAISAILWSIYATSQPSIQLESANLIKSCDSNNKPEVFNLKFINTTKTESLTIQNKPCASTATKPISQINTI